MVNFRLLLVSWTAAAASSSIPGQLLICPNTFLLDLPNACFFGFSPTVIWEKIGSLRPWVPANWSKMTASLNSVFSVLTFS